MFLGILLGKGYYKMKRYTCLVLTAVLAALIAFSIPITATASEDLTPYVRRVFYNRGTSVNYSGIPSQRVHKITSALDFDIVSSSEYENIFDGRYDESFFDDSFLILIRSKENSSSHSLRVSSIRGTDSSIDVVVERVSRVVTPDSDTWHIVIEMDWIEFSLQGMFRCLY
jgi:hypothetical protein